MAAKIKVTSSLPSKKTIAKKLGATQADIDSVQQIIGNPLQLVPQSAKTKSFRKKLERIGAVDMKEALYIICAETGTLTSQEGTVSIQDLITAKRKK